MNDLQRRRLERAVDDLPSIVRSKVAARRSSRWLDELPDLLIDLEDRWSLTVGSVLDGGTEAFVAEVVLADGTDAVLKLLVPGRGDEPAGGDSGGGPPDNGRLANEISVLELVGGDGCPRLYHADRDRLAMVVERLGRPMVDLGLPIEERHRHLVEAASRVWRPVSDPDLPTGRWKAEWLIDYVERQWEALGRPCSERAVTHALECATRRAAAHDDERAVLVHGDVHQWNALEADRTGDPQPQNRFKLVDPDGLRAEPEYDLGILMREDPVELLDGDPRHRARSLAAMVDLDPVAVWEWGVVERVSTGLVATEIDLQPEAGYMLAAADRIAVDYREFSR